MKYPIGFTDNDVNNEVRLGEKVVGQPTREIMKKTNSKNRPKDKRILLVIVIIVSMVPHNYSAYSAYKLVYKLQATTT